MIPSRLVPLSLIDPPDVAMRTQIADEDIAALARDIAAHGLLHPVSLIRVGERYKIAAGHCRYLAHKLLGREEIESKDYTNANISPQAIKFAENKRRRDVNPADEALWLAEIQDQFHYTLEQLQELTGESEDWLSKRLSLFHGDKKVYDALARGDLNLGQAVTLNRFPDHMRQQYLLQAIQSTPPVRVLEDWLHQCKLMNIQPQQTEESAAQGGGPAPLPGVVLDVCPLCVSNTAPWDMQFFKMHKTCLESILKAIKDQMGGG